LIADLQAHPEYIPEVLQRLLSLLGKNPHPDHLHPYDAALAAYLYALNQVDPDSAQRAVDSLL
jgi:hypothetical protein